MRLSPFKAGGRKNGKGVYTMKKEYTTEDFHANTYAYGAAMKEDGHFSLSSGKYEINYSGILSRLIQEAGRFCERFASDLFIDWRRVEKWIDNSVSSVHDETVFLFGFRKDGVDNELSILSRYNGGAYAYPEKEYRSMWRLWVAVDERRNITMTLGRVF